MAVQADVDAIDLESAAEAELAAAANGQFLATARASPRQRRLALAAIAVSTLVFLAAIPFAKVKLAPVDAFIPAYESALLITDFVTAVLLLGQFMKLRSPAMLVLAAGYLFDALIIIPHALSFPGMLAPAGVIGGGPQTTAWLYAFWHAGFPAAVIAYALLKDRDDAIVPTAAARAALIAAAAVVLIVLALTAAATLGHDSLPPIMRENRYTPIAIFFLGASWVFSIVAVAVLWWRGIRSILDLWIAVVMLAWVYDVALSAVFNGGRFDLGFYVGRGYGFLAASFVLAVVLIETSGLFSRLAETTAELQGRAARLQGDVREARARSREVEAQLRQAQKMEAIGNLTGGMAHDFNNLLAVIVGNLDLLIERRKDDDEVRELGSEARDAALQGADLTQRLLAFARRQPLSPRLVEINGLVSEHAKLLRRLLGAQIDVRLELAPDVWPAVIDPTQLESAITNLAANARDAMPEGTGTLTIATGNRHLDTDYAAANPEVMPGDYALIEVSDSGSGIPPEILARIFEPFFTTKEKGKGTGLGLSMVYGFMKQSKGHVSVYSEAGVGTTFRLYLPRASAETAAATGPAPVAAAEGRGETVLAVEDVPSLRKVACRQLAELGYRVIEADSAAAALVILETQAVDVLFTDIVLAGGPTGVSLAREAKERWPNLRIVFTSGFPDTNAAFGATSGSVKLLGKPFRKEELAKAIRQALDAT